MKKFVIAAAVAAIGAVSLPALAQNIATVNGKAVPKARADLLISQIAKSGQPRSPEMETKVKDEVVLREIFMQEAEKRGLAATPDYKAQLELARQSLLIRELFADYAKKNPVTEAEAKVEYDKFKAQASGTEYHARHILVEKEDDAKALIKQLNGGAKFEDVASKNSKDTGSATNGGDLGWSAPDAFVPEFSQAMSKLKAGEMTQQPVKSQFGYHIIKLEESREAQFPAFDDVKGQIIQRMGQQKVSAFQEELRNKAKTDYKFSAN
ncbi:peptidylprolyl isomerase [Roseateles amylovorans]|jgi:peptidyl-prolyl cis-trans isomerase C|uniref:peptidylprolyl isomerase n=1 Tax=Roseateles amylovorans TaxID=2978473 RepID=A0ABY6AWF4_9BURK|nr:peptidylprolyl isomerase [Roseateles amylovorans]UXH77212.1 peptidylprolyl isomerase [Roseateles amylovorans]